MTLRLTDKWAGWIEEDLPPLLLGDKVEYELIPGLGQQGPAMLIVFYAPGPLLGTMMHAMSEVPNPGAITKENLAGVLRGMVDMLAQERTKQLSQGGSGPIPHPSTNGGPVPPGGHLRGM